MSAQATAASGRHARRADAPRAESGALVVGAEYRGLGLVRSLGRQGIPVWVVEHDDDVLASRSRYTRRSLRLPEGDDEEQVGFLLELAEREGLEGWTLFPTADETAALVARHHAALGERYVLTTPPWDMLRWAYDKRLTYRLAQTLDVDAPKTWYPEPGTDPGLLGVEFPAILKPAIKVDSNPLTTAKAWRVDDVVELRARYAEACGFMDPQALMVQELVPGGGEAQFSYAALCEQGRPLSDIVARRTRQYPPDFGRASTYVESVECPEIVGPSRLLLEEMRFDGLVELEYKLDRRDGRYKLLDINPRVWGWHTLCAGAGVDFPYLDWRRVHGEPVPELHGRPGVRWVRLSTDLPTSVKQMLRGRLSPVAYLRSLRRADGAIFAPDDPLPGLVELPLLARVIVRRLRSGRPV
jgi:D-aspartate ligase